jgi:hypothetical protein
VLAEADDLRAGNRLGRDQFLQERIGRRAVRTALGREQLDDHRRRSFGAAQGSMHPAQRQRDGEQ